LILRGERLRDELALDGLLVTLGERGMLLLQRGEPALHLPTRARDVYDVTGAGDTVVAVLSAAVAAGASLVDAAGLANLAAGLVVGKLGTASVSPVELRGAVRQQGEWSAVHSEPDLLAAVEEARVAGERIVMTNGCFDILHEGHVKYLQQARRLGDRLVVAVNADASVRRLKGEGRPVNDLAQRLAVLAGLASVDWLVAFEEETPAPLLGMKIHNDGLAGKVPKGRLEFCYSSGRGGPKTRTSARTHGGFDNDIRTMNDILRRVLGKTRPRRLFTRGDLDY
jgi:D-beta-D-heptose 7-phosphate kinase/D-beta-D-heptose 1-phosphate adenosyltransferase